jgi:hypothetical protein
MPRKYVNARARRAAVPLLSSEYKEHNNKSGARSFAISRSFLTIVAPPMT